MIARLKDISRSLGGDWQITISTRENPVTMFHRLKDFDVTVEIKKATKPRSMDANRFCWAMCNDISAALRITKEEVYRRAIREVGKYSMMLMLNEAVPPFREIWGQRGIGWFADIVDDSKKNPGCKVIFAYYGTSTYTSDEMSRVLDWLKDEMVQMELPIPMSKEDERRALELWGKSQSSSKAIPGASSVAG